MPRIFATSASSSRFWACHPASFVAIACVMAREDRTVEEKTESELFVQPIVSCLGARWDCRVALGGEYWSYRYFTSLWHLSDAGAEIDS